MSSALLNNGLRNICRIQTRCPSCTETVVTLASNANFFQHIFHHRSEFILSKWGTSIPRLVFLAGGIAIQLAVMSLNEDSCVISLSLLENVVELVQFHASLAWAWTNSWVLKPISPIMPLTRLRLGRLWSWRLG